MKLGKLLNKIEDSPYEDSSNCESYIKGLTILDEVYSRKSSNLESKFLKKVDKYASESSIEEFLYSVKSELDDEDVLNDFMSLEEEHSHSDVESTINIIRGLREKNPVNGSEFDYESFMTGVKRLSTLIKPLYNEYENNNCLASLFVKPFLNKYAGEINNKILDYKSSNN